jgi:Nif-specific regulatory protein
VAEGRFREDLYYRTRVVEIDVPSLADRGPDEVERLARHFVGVYAQRYRRPSPELRADALEVLRSHRWPGNVRELEHWIESAMVLCPDGAISSAHLPSCRRARVARSEDSAVHLTLAEASRAHAIAVLEDCEGNKSQAARRLAIGRNTLARLLAYIP